MAKPTLDEIFNSSPNPSSIPTGSAEMQTSNRKPLNDILQLNKKVDEKLPSQDSANPSQTKEKPGIFSRVLQFQESANKWSPGQFLLGQVKGLGDTALGYGELGSRALEGGYNATIGKLTGQEAIKGADAAQKARESDYIKPTGVLQGAGYASEKVGEFLVPGTVASKGASAISKANNIGRVGELAVRAGLDTGLGLATAAGQRGDLSVEDAKQAAFSGGMSVAGKIPQAALGAYQIGKGAKDVYEGDKTGGLIEAGFGVMSLLGAKNARGAFLDLPPNPQKVRERAVKTYENLLSSKGEDKKQLQAALRNSPKKSPYETAVDHGITLDWDEGSGKLNTQNAAEDVQSKIEKWDELLDDVLATDQQPRHSLDDIQAKAMSKIDKSGKSASEKRRIKEHIASYIADEKDVFGDGLQQSKDLNQIKRGLYREGYNQGRKLETEAAEAANLLASVMKSDIEAAVPIPQVKQVNSVIGELSDLRRVLENKQGAVVKGGKVGRWASQLLGAITGSHGGPLGTMAVSAVADKLHMRSIDPYIATVSAQKHLDLSEFKPEWQKTRQDTIDALIQNTVNPKQFPLLTEGKQIDLPEATPRLAEIDRQKSIDDSRIFSQAEIAERMKPYYSESTKRTAEMLTGNKLKGAYSVEGAKIVDRSKKPKLIYPDGTEVSISKREMLELERSGLPVSQQEKKPSKALSTKPTQSKK